MKRNDVGIGIPSRLKGGDVDVNGEFGGFELGSWVREVV
jgi:hypothetical protein